MNKINEKTKKRGNDLWFFSRFEQLSVPKQVLCDANAEVIRKNSLPAERGITCWKAFRKDFTAKFSYFRDNPRQTKCNVPWNA
jgi:hypothetical protein